MPGNNSVDHQKYSTITVHIGHGSMQSKVYATIIPCIYSTLSVDHTQLVKDILTYWLNLEVRTNCEDQEMTNQNKMACLTFS